MRIYKAPVITRTTPQQTQPPAVVNRGQFINHCVKISNIKYQIAKEIHHLIFGRSRHS